MAFKTFIHPIRVTYAECTVGNHVYYGRYLDYLEEGRGEFFRHLGLSFLHWQGAGTIFPVIELRLRYKGPARYDDLLQLELWLTEAQRTKSTFAYKIWGPGNRLLVEGESVHVCTGLDEKPKRLPDELLRAIPLFLQMPVDPTET